MKTARLSNVSHYCRGFSLLEVMCAILILGIGLVGLTQGVGTALRASKESELQTAAALMAAAQIELLRADGFVVEGETEGEGSGVLASYTWRQSVTETALEGLYDVQVLVENAAGKEIYDLRTLLFDPPYSSTNETKTASDPARRERAR